MFDCLVPRLAALLLLCAAGTAQVIEYAHVLSFAESCQQGPVISAAAVRLDFCTHFPSGGFYKHTWDKDSQGELLLLLGPLAAAADSCCLAVWSLCACAVLG